MTDAEIEAAVVSSEKLYLLYRRSAPPGSGLKRFIRENRDLLIILIEEEESVIHNGRQ